MHTNTQAFFHKLIATTARLRRVAGVHKHDMCTSIYRFVAQQRLEQPQARVVG